MKTAIVSGAAGFVGKALISELVHCGVHVWAVVRNEQADMSEFRDNPAVRVVCCEMDLLDTLPQKITEPADVFFHLAWTGSTGPARGDYALQLTNARWTTDAVRAAHRIGCKRFVGAGTLAELDVNAYSPVAGSTPNAVSCYGAAKIAAHYMSKAECCRLGVEHLWAYLSNTYGEGNYTSNFINFAAKTMLTGQSADFTSGEQMYDFVHVSDTARGLRCIGEKGRKNTAYYIGSSKPSKLKEFISAIRNEIDPAIQLNLGAVPFRGVEQPAEVFDCSSIINEAGYRPCVPFEEGIKRTVAWLRTEIMEGRL